MRTPAAQSPMLCFQNIEQAAEKAGEHGEKLRFVGHNFIGIKMFFFIGPKSWTVFIESETGHICSAPAMMGLRHKKPGIDT
mgnify:CR=1 FL=1